MKKLPCFIILTMISLTSFAQSTAELTGHWKGQIKVPGNPLSIKTHFQKQADSLKGTIKVQGVTLPLQKISITDQDSVFFEFMAGPGLAEFRGTFQGDSAIGGTFYQRGMEFPFKLKRYEPKIDTVKKPPKEPLPYNQQELIIKNDSIKIGGTLTWPENQSANTLVIMISGSGAQDRDETLKPISDFKPFALLADSLTMNGIATFRYDDRGVGQSTGNFSNATLGILADDTEAIISEFTDAEGQHFEEIILLGHSQGGMVAGKVANENKAVDKIILMASTGVPLKRVLRFQVQRAFESLPIDTQLVEQEIAAREQLMESIRKGKGVKEAQEKYQKRFAAIQMAVGADSTRAANIAENQTKQLKSAYSSTQMQSLLFYNPVEDLQQLNIPVLVLFGGKDTQVTVEMNKVPIKKALESTGVPYKIKVFENANHPFQKAKTGNVQEYGSLEKQFVEGFTSTIVQWVKKQ